MSKFYDIKGIVECPDEMTPDEFMDRFVDFLEENGCFFGGIFVEKQEEIEGELYVDDEFVAKFGATDMRSLKRTATLKLNKYKKKLGEWGKIRPSVLRVGDCEMRYVSGFGWKEDAE